MAARLNNETYNIAERLIDDPSYMRRAQQVKNRYGDDYTFCICRYNQYI